MSKPGVHCKWYLCFDIHY